PARRPTCSGAGTGLPAPDGRRAGSRTRSTARPRVMTPLPLAARALLRCIDPLVREFVAGDIEEAFSRIAETDGQQRARRWALRQAAAAALQHPWKPSRSRPTGD